MLAQPRPEPQKRVKARSKRETAKIVRMVRAACVDRDGRCRYANDVHVAALDDGRACITACEGESEWAHLEDKQRFKTRCQLPLERHTTQHSAMLCSRHHELYDRGYLSLRFLTDLGADGPLAWERT
jgi:hypothetical protein